MAEPLSPSSPTRLNTGSPSIQLKENLRRVSFANASPHCSPKADLCNSYHRFAEPENAPSSPFEANPTNAMEPQNSSRTPLKARSRPDPSTSPAHFAQEATIGRVAAEPLMMQEETIIHHDIDEVDDNLEDDAEDAASAIGDVTGLSTFSIIPNADITVFTPTGQRHHLDDEENSIKHTQTHSPKRDLKNTYTPRRRVQANTPSTARRDFDPSYSPSSPTPRRRLGAREENDTTNLLVDFTEQFNALTSSSSSFSYSSPARRGRESPAKSQSQTDIASGGRGPTPSPQKYALPSSTRSERRSLANLLDFDIPPPPTPRSVPSITARELESLKSGYLSQISTLKASLSGKEAEAQSLKEALGDAERRVGMAKEELRDERGARQALLADKQSWEGRGKEMENVLRSVKDEIMRGEREKENLATRLEENVRRREEAEMKACEAESRATATEAGSDAPSGDATEQVRVAVERVARELHNMYKGKHESKVTALKKSYESRWSKQVRELERKLEDLSKENEELRTSRDATMSGVVPGMLTATAADGGEKVTDEAGAAQRAEEQKAKMAGLIEEIQSLKGDNDLLIGQLEKERVEKGELVMAVDEMLTLSQAANAGSESASTGLEHLRGSISRASGMKPPGFSSNAITGGSKIGQPRSRNGSIASGGRSGGIMSSIERMGRGRVD
ncbi:MAG: hypothetical protein M1817_002967 [Caeruleum heppii]|nr:MAG: hypothetical protein M1817_002967 [Caeruleum heppii]